MIFRDMTCLLFKKKMWNILTIKLSLIWKKSQENMIIKRPTQSDMVGK